MLQTSDEFEFGTKGESLERLKARLGGSILCDQILFDLGTWRRDSAAVVERVLDRFPESTLAVRSSAIGEDSWVSSMAGVYTSLTGVAPRPESLIEAVERVIESYGETSDGDQILVQPMVADVVISGVVMTRDLDTGSPYYVVNYDDVTGRTDSVTAGAESKTLLIHRSRPDAVRSPRIGKLIEIVRRIEAATGSDELDIEFCITNRDLVYILQVRPLAVRRQWSRFPDATIDAALAEVRADIGRRKARQEGLAGETTIFGDMPDWNPAEMIGSAPKPLALSLYRYLITDSTWVRARIEMGYRRMPIEPLLVVFAGRPYIDVRRSLNSFLPDGLDDGFADRLVTYQLDRLAANRDLHDKIEFAIAVPSRDLDFGARAEELLGAGFSASEVRAFGDRLHKVTAAALAAGGGGIDRLLGLCRELASRHAALGDLPPRERACRLLEECIGKGTLPFSILARHGFIGVAFLRSLVRRGALDQEAADRFMLSIHTVAADIVDDMDALAAGSLGRDAFLERYGHLRPGTYDIHSWRYDERPDLYLGASGRPGVAREAFEIGDRQENDIARLLAEEGYDIAPADLFRYIESAIRAREMAKFHFTRAVSDALAALVSWGERIGLDRDDLSHLTVDDVREGGDVGRLREIVARARDDHDVTRAIRLPHLIIEPTDVDVVRVPLGRPTFITSRSVTASAKVLSVNETTDIDGRIVLIESADPGFDWIFSHDIVGLVTKYGGANSHMAIRCAEFGLPAAIGCGERLFDTLARSPVIDLNCAARTVKPQRT